MLDRYSCYYDTNVFGEKIGAEMLKRDFSPLQSHVGVTEKGKALLTSLMRSAEERDRLFQINKIILRKYSFVNNRC